MKLDKELSKTVKVSLGEDNIIHLTCFKFEKEAENNAQVIEIVKDKIFEIFNEQPKKKFKILGDISLAGGIIGAQGFSAKTRKTALQLISHKQLGKAAFVTKNTIVKTVIGFIIAVSGRGKNMQWFSDKKEAIEWLKK